MKKSEINERKVYLQSLRTDLSLNDNAAVSNEMNARAKHIEAIRKALISANVNIENVPGISIFPNINKSKIGSKYLHDLFYFETIKDDSKAIITKGDFNIFCRSKNISTKDKDSWDKFKLEFSKVVDQINACIAYFNIENIEVEVEYDAPNCKVYIKLLPSEDYKEYLKKIKFVSLDKFISQKEKLK